MSQSQEQTDSEITSSPQTFEDLWEEALALRKKFRDLHPELDTLPKGRQFELWHEFMGVKVPLVASKVDPYREASCLTCLDIGWIVTRDHEDTTVTPCPHCSAWEDEKKERILAHSGIPETRRECRFESLNWEVPGIDDAAHSAWVLSKGQSEYKLLLIYGVNGCGKSHIAFAAGLEAKDRGLWVKFVDVRNLMHRLRLGMETDTDRPEGIIKELKDCDFLILDDLMAMQGTPYQVAVIEDLVNHFYMFEKPLIATMDCSFKRLETVNKAIASRFKDKKLCKVCWNQAGDYRPKRKVVDNV